MQFKQHKVANDYFGDKLFQVGIW